MDNGLEIFERLESRVRSYCRVFPVVFTRACGSRIWDEQGRSYIDFFCGAGALNYGHNPPEIMDAVVGYIRGGGILHALDCATAAKRAFLTAFEEVIARPRSLDYRVQFPGPTGTNAVEAALKLARLVTGRHNIVAFTNAFHGMSLGSLACSGNADKRSGAGLPLGSVSRFPYEGYPGVADAAALLDVMLDDPGSGVDAPAAIIVETIQGEGGVKVASFDWLRRVEQIARRHGSLLIVDEIQTGCGRTGPFFSFEAAGITPDLVCLSKSISGIGLPMALVLIRPDLDVWKPGQHNGTFRGNNLAFVAATATLNYYWRTLSLPSQVESTLQVVRDRLGAIASRVGEPIRSVRGRGMLWGVEFRDPSVASAVSSACFSRGLIIETSGAKSQVLKLMPPLTIEQGELATGLDIIEESINQVLASREHQPDAAFAKRPREEALLTNDLVDE
jgi:diaminobutyrate-2-oxoglutarate transaminase